jgi:hypothetical protein
MSVAALDTYMHRLIVRRARNHTNLPTKLANLGIPFEYVQELAETAKRDARAAPRNTRPTVGMKKALRDSLLQMTFQSFEDISKGLGMAGLNGNWGVIGPAMTPPQNTTQITKRLIEIGSRRNHVVHEGDYIRQEKPQTARLNPITHAEGVADVDYIGDLIDGIFALPGAS